MSQQEPEEREVFPGSWYDVYHTYQFCNGNHYPSESAIPLSEAKDDGLRKCPKCDSLPIP